MKGLGCVLLQDGKPICYASRSLNGAEQRYSNIERELLAIVWALEKLNHYVYGKHTVIETDHKPLENIWKKTIESASPRLQRLLLRLTRYDIDIKHIPGKQNVVADALSRVCHMEAPPGPNEVPDIDIDTITRTLPATPSKLNEIRAETDKDQTLSHLKDMVHNGWPDFIAECPTDLKEFWTYRESLSIENGIVLKGHRILMPPSLRPQTLTLIHQGHLGTEKCLLKAKDSVFWPKISTDIQKLTNECSTCQQFSKKPSREPLIPHSIPSYPWQKLGADLFDYKSSQYLLVSDYYSKFPLARKLDSLTSSTVIQHLKSIFAENGIPEMLVTDNGPQFSCREFATFCVQWEIDHVTSSPLYPQSNGHIERMVQTVKNLLKKSEASGEDPYIALLTYRTTPVDFKLPAPATLLNGRKYRTQLPCSGHLQRSKVDEDNVEQLVHRQQQQKRHYDKNSSSEMSNLVPKQPVSIYVPNTSLSTRL